MKTKNLKFTFHVIDSGDSSVGIFSTYEKVNIEVEYGFYDEFTKNEFEKGMKEFLHDFYEECRCRVLTDEEYQQEIEGERCEEEYYKKLNEKYDNYLSENKEDMRELKSIIEFERELEDEAIDKMERMAENE